MKRLLALLLLASLPLTTFSEKLNPVQRKYKPKVAYAGKQYLKSMDILKREMVKEYEVMLKTALKKGDLDAANAVKGKLDALNAGSITIPEDVSKQDAVQRKYNPKNKALKKKFQDTINKYKKSMLAEYKILLKREMKARRLEEANKVQANIKALSPPEKGKKEEENTDFGLDLGIPKAPLSAAGIKSAKIKGFKYIGSKRDKVGRGPKGKPDGTKDSRFSLRLELPANTVIKTIEMRGAKGGVWHTQRNWVIGVIYRKKQLFDKFTDEIGTFSGRPDFELYINDGFNINQDNYITIIIKLSDGTTLTEKCRMK